MKKIAAIMVFVVAAIVCYYFLMALVADGQQVYFAGQAVARSLDPIQKFIALVFTFAAGAVAVKAASVVVASDPKQKGVYHVRY